MIDGWEDPQRMQVFGLLVCFSLSSFHLNGLAHCFQVQSSRGAKLMVKLERHTTSENLEACAKHIEEMLTEVDIKKASIVSLSSDNCPAIVAAVKEVCFHCGNPTM